MENMLSRMVRAGYSCATILTHPGEYFRRNNNDTVFVSKNCERLERLLNHAKEVNELRFQTVNRCLEEATVPTLPPPELVLKLNYSLMRLLAQYLDRIRMFYYSLPR